MRPIPTPPLASPTAAAAHAKGSLTETCHIGYCTQNDGTKGGVGGPTTNVSTLAELTAAAGSSGPMVIVVHGAIAGSAQVKVSSNKSIIGTQGSSLTGIGFSIKRVSNVIVRNIKISKVQASNGDGITIEASKNVWVDHCELSSDLSHDKDYYDGLLDIVHGSEWVTVSNSYLHDHFKASLVGHSDRNAAEDTGHLHVTYAYNRWNNINSRAPSFRFGTGHVYNSYFSNILNSGINTRMGAQLLVQSCFFEGAKRAITSDDSDSKGFATVQDVELGGSVDSAPKGDMATTGVPYTYTLLGSAYVKGNVSATAGQTLMFE